jgi:hypothetical protein
MCKQALSKVLNVIETLCSGKGKRFLFARIKRFVKVFPFFGSFQYDQA